MPGAIDALQQVSLFDDLEPVELQQIADAMHELVYSSGDPVTIEGADGDAFFIVGSGTAEVVIDGETRATIGPGGHFGEIALLHGSPRTATVRAVSDLRCYVLSPLEFRDIVEGNPSIAWRVLQSLNERLG